MWGKASIILEIVAGVLLAIHFIVKSTFHTKIDKWLFTRLSRKITPRGRLRKSVIFIAGITTTVILIGVAIWGFIKDMHGKSIPTGNLIASYIIFVIAVFAGVLTIFGIAWIHGKYTVFRRSDPLGFVYFLSVFLGLMLVFSIVFTKGSIFITSFMVTYSVSIMITGLWVMLMPLAQKYLTIKSGVLVRFGLVLFIVAKIIQLKLAS